LKQFNKFIYRSIGFKNIYKLSFDFNTIKALGGPQIIHKVGEKIVKILRLEL